MRLKNILYAVLFLLFAFGIITAEAAENEHIGNLFQSANNLYQEGKYQQAANEYNEILFEGWQSGPLYYNLGNCYFKLGLLGKTILFYEKAKRLIPYDPELEFNYNYVYSLLKDKITIPRSIWLVQQYRRFVQLFSFSQWLGFIIICWLLLMAAVTAAVSLSRGKRFLRNTAICLLALLLLSSICATVRYQTAQRTAAVILAEEVSVRYGPGEGEVEAFLLHEGCKTTIIKDSGDWYQIQLPDGTSGWLPKDTTGKI